ncbi:ABC transporter permease [Clostridium sp. SHJSY1]|uniref:ABC transporter permease n=1 Tax=Clostridium sp. SHJSY1 TaxID=2942483 RepID=UPI002874A4E1|nr:ABC transporter permease [Clostridium sp. SHJSY1]MDS0524667.1 ABC transporter permease [Clostridium sp. SHJSY1]
MLGKLLKYEFKSTARILLPLYIALIGFSIINKVLIGFRYDFQNFSGLGGIPAIISILGYVATMVAIVVVTLFIIIQRFYKNLLGDEGYLMNTLPVSINKNISSKLIVAVSWNLISGIVAFLSIFIMAYRPGIFNEMFAQVGGFTGFLSIAYDKIGSNMYTIPLELIILGLVALIRGILIIYASIALGQLANKRKILAAFGAFVVLNIVMSVIQEMIPSIFVNLDNLNITLNSLTPVVHGGIISLIIFELIFSGIFFATCNYILKNKLNLE